MFKILIIDDDLSQIDLYRSAFKNKGFEVHTASNIEEGFRGAQEKPDLILLDIVLGKEDGLDLLRKIRKDEELKNLKVLVMTNLTKPGLDQEVKQAGADDFVMKTDYVPSGLVKKLIV